jgi:hypothetical protein
MSTTPHLICSIKREKHKRSDMRISFVVFSNSIALYYLINMNLVDNPSFNYMIMRFLFGLMLIGCVLAAECHGQPGARAINHNPTWSGEPRLLKTHKYGKLFEVGDGSTITKLLHVYGDMYQMGFAHGSLLK